MQRGLKNKNNYIKSLLQQLLKQGDIIYFFQNQSNHKYIRKTINQNKPTDVIETLTSDNKTHTAESIQENTKTTKDNVTESKDNTSPNKKIDNDLKQNAKRVYALGVTLCQRLYDISSFLENWKVYVKGFWLKRKFRLYNYTCWYK